MTALDVTALDVADGPDQGAGGAPRSWDAGGFEELGAAGRVEPSSWRPLDLTAYLDGSYEPERATLLPRSDGACLLYPGRLHSFHGESESGKSMVARAEAARLLSAGERVLFIDFENDAATVVPRLVAMGATPDAIRERFMFVQPQEPPAGLDGRQAFEELFGQRYALAVIDGMTDALGMFGTNSLDLDEVARFMRMFPRRLARSTGAAVVVIDHVTKAQDTRGRFAVGSQAKMNGLDGAAYVIEVVQPLGLRMRGVVSMRVAKDRPGSVRPVCGAYRKGDRTQEACRVVFDATGDNQRTVVQIEPPDARFEDGPQSGPVRPKALMQRISEWLEVEGRGSATANELYEGVGAKEQHTRQAVALLVAEGYVKAAPGPRRSTLHSSCRPYRQARDQAPGNDAGHQAPKPP